MAKNSPDRIPPNSVLVALENSLTSFIQIEATAVELASTSSATPLNQAEKWVTLNAAAIVLANSIIESVADPHQDKLFPIPPDFGGSSIQEVSAQSPEVRTVTPDPQPSPDDWKITKLCNGVAPALQEYGPLMVATGLFEQTRNQTSGVAALTLLRYSSYLATDRPGLMYPNLEGSFEVLQLTLNALAGRLLSDGIPHQR